jgi:hypothetical protein
MSNDFISDFLQSPTTPNATKVNTIDDSGGSEVSDFKRIFAIEERRLEKSQIQFASENTQGKAPILDQEVESVDSGLEDERQALGAGLIGSGNQVPDLAVHLGALSVGRVVFTPRQVAVTPQSLAKFMARQGLVSEQMGKEIAESGDRSTKLSDSSNVSSGEARTGLHIGNVSGGLMSGAPDQIAGLQNDEVKSKNPETSPMPMRSPQDASSPRRDIVNDHTSAQTETDPEILLRRGANSTLIEPSRISQPITLTGGTLAGALRFKQPINPINPSAVPNLGRSQLESTGPSLTAPPVDLDSSEPVDQDKSQLISGEQLRTRDGRYGQNLRGGQPIALGAMLTDSEGIEPKDSGGSSRFDDPGVANMRLGYEVSPKSKLHESNATLSIQKFLGEVRETLDLVNSPENRALPSSDQPNTGGVRHYQENASALAAHTGGQQKIEFRGTLSEAQRFVESGTYNNLTDSYESWTSRFGEVLANRIMGQVRQDNWSVQLRMSPASLGDISMELDFSDGGLEGRLGANEDATRQLLQDTLPRLRLALRDVLEGGQVLKLDVGEFKHSQQQSGSNQSADTPQVEDLDFEAEVLNGRTLEPTLGSVVGLNILV